MALDFSAKILRRRWNASTLQRFNASTLQRFNASTLQRFNASTLQRFNASMPPTPTPRPPSWRWVVCGLLLLASAVNYMDRQTLAGASVRISREFSLTQTAYGEVEAAFGYAFAAGSLVFGWMADRFPVRWVYAGVLALWSLAGIATGTARDHGDLLLWRAVLGFFEAGHWPCAVRTTRMVLDERQRSLGNGLLQGGATLGAVVTPLVLPWLMRDGAGGWRPPFLFLGLVGLAWLVPWLLVVRAGDLPAERPAERAPGSGPRDGESFLRVVFSGRMLAVLAVVACINTTWQVLRAWLPKFLQEGRGYDETAALRFNSAWFLAADVGCIAAGALATWLANRGRTPHAARFTVFAGCALAAALTVLAPRLPAGAPLLGVLLLVAAGSLGVFPLYHTFTQDLSARHQGKVTGLAGVAAWLLPAQAQRFFGVLADRTGSMDTGLALAGLLPLLALLPLWFLRPRAAKPAATPP
jgi:MFS transporter, ACS family, hexuronate transporter